MAGEQQISDLDFIDPSGANREAVRRMGYAVVDLITEYFATVEERGVFSGITPNKMAELLSEKLPEEGKNYEDVLVECRDRVIANSVFFGHPNYVGHMITQPTVMAIFADALTAALNQSVFLWEVGPAAAHLEMEVIRWFAELFGLGDQSGGTFVTGGTVANLTAILVARNLKLPIDAGREGLSSPRLHQTPVFFTSEYSHFSIQKAASFAGLGTDNLILIRTDEGGRMSMADLRAKIRGAREANQLPFCVVATAGTTVAGHIDPLPEIEQICRESDLWFHVDAAHGGTLAFSSSRRHLLEGISKADSIAFDAHKWLYMSIPASSILFQDGSLLERYLHFKAPYIVDIPSDTGKRVNQGEMTVQGTRRFDALKTWLSLKHLGRRHFGAMVDRTVDLAHYMASRVQASDNLETCAQVTVNICCFRYLPKVLRQRKDDLGEAARRQVETFLDNLNVEVQKRLEASGKGFVSISTFQGKKVLRAIIHNRCVQKANIDHVLNAVCHLGQAVYEERKPELGI
jgi:glutamate/tyrosine decarboxylase-like PLP-dependent enzyme